MHRVAPAICISGPPNLASRVPQPFYHRLQYPCIDIINPFQHVIPGPRQFISSQVSLRHLRLLYLTEPRMDRPQNIQNPGRLRRLLYMGDIPRPALRTSISFSTWEAAKRGRLGGYHSADRISFRRTPRDDDGMWNARLIHHAQSVLSRVRRKCAGGSVSRHASHARTDHQESPPDRGGVDGVQILVP